MSAQFSLERSVRYSVVFPTKPADRDKEATKITNKIRIIQYGLGPIGCAAARLIAERNSLELVGGVDIDPAKVGKDLGDVIGLEDSIGIDVKGSIGDVDVEADVVLHATNSFFDQFKGQILELLDAGFDVVSTSEELSFPWHDNADAAAEIDAAAKNAGKTVLGTGVNPGFLMDSLPLFITSIAQQVDHIDVTRVINASKRRGPFQAKIGSGLTPEQFNAKMAEGRMGHVGIPESTAMIFDTLGKKLVSFENKVVPVIAETPVKTSHFDVQEGQVRGLHQTSTAHSEDGEFVSLTFRAALDEEPDGDTITIQGRPELTVNLQGTNGDLATVAMAVNAIKNTKNAAPGVVTMRDLPIVSFC
jgi:4-hydroxy-tetrahydrodipicolinate reductase